MKNIYILVTLTCCFFVANSQVVNRYPYIQSPDQSSVIIAWNTDTAGVGTLTWGSSAGSLTNTVTDIASTQTHALSITGLQANTKYYYQATCGSFQSNVEYFYTAKPNNVRQMDFVVYGDCGFNSAPEDSLSAHMATINHDFGLVVGDVDQYFGTDYDVDYFQHYTAMTKNICHFTTIGNHDTLTNQTNYINQFYLPHNNPANTELYYSFTWGHAKFIALDGDIDYSVGSPQYTWFESQLQCNNSEWTFVFFHQPPWTNAWDITYYIPDQSWYQYQGNADMRTTLVPLFEKYHVDAVLNGHAHDYQRGVYNGVHYFIAGGGGTTDPDTHTNSSSPNIQFECDSNNFMNFSINGDSVHYYAYWLNGAPIDSGSFTKTYTAYAATISSQNAGCGALNNGSALIQVNGPRAPYTFQWSNGSTAALDTQLTAGTYYVTITDSSGCISNDTATISTVSTVTHLQISESSAGLTAQLSASQSNAGTYTWVLGNGVTLTDTTSSISYTYADSGSYTVELITNENCGTDTSIITLSVASDSISGILQVGGDYLSVNVFPNPFGNQTVLNVSGKTMQQFFASLYNVDGQLIRTMPGTTGTNLVISREGISAGNYLLVIRAGNARSTIKVVVQ